MIEIRTTIIETEHGLASRGVVRRENPTELEEDAFARMAAKIAEACNEFSQAHNGTHLMVQTDTRPK